MGKGVSLSPSETPRGNRVVQVTLLPISLRTSPAVEVMPPTALPNWERVLEGRVEARSQDVVELIG